MLFRSAVSYCGKLTAKPLTVRNFQGHEKPRQARLIFSKKLIRKKNSQKSSREINGKRLKIPGEHAIPSFGSTTRHASRVVVKRSVVNSFYIIFYPFSPFHSFSRPHISLFLISAPSVLILPRRLQPSASSPPSMFHLNSALPHFIRVDPPCPADDRLPPSTTHQAKLKAST